MAEVMKSKNEIEFRSDIVRNTRGKINTGEVEAGKLTFLQFLYDTLVKLFAGRGEAGNERIPYQCSITSAFFGSNNPSIFFPGLLVIWNHEAGQTRLPRRSMTEPRHT